MAACFSQQLRQPIAVNACLAVCDFGGGTFDVAIMRRETQGFAVLADGGLRDLGGLDVAAALIDHLKELDTPSAGEWHTLLSSHDDPLQRETTNPVG